MTKFKQSCSEYLKRLYGSFSSEIYADIELLANDLMNAWKEKRNVYICGNGGSAANAVHMANDFHYGIGACGAGPKIPGLRIEALPANEGIITCLANDTGYENIYAHQLTVKAEKDDLLIVLSGSGNSSNIVRALKEGKEIGMKSYAIVGYNGGESKKVADHSIHFNVNDMQIAEDSQLIVGHLCMQWLSKNKPVV